MKKIIMAIALIASSNAYSSDLNSEEQLALQLALWKTFKEEAAEGQSKYRLLAQAIEKRATEENTMVAGLNGYSYDVQTSTVSADVVFWNDENVIISTTFKPKE